MYVQVRQKILESHANVKDLNLLEAKMNFIRAWQSLPEYGVSLFVVRYVSSFCPSFSVKESDPLLFLQLSKGNADLPFK